MGQQVHVLTEAQLKAGRTVIDLAKHKAALRAQHFDANTGRARFDAAVGARFDSEGVHPYEMLTDIERQVVSQQHTPLEGRLVVPIDATLALHTKHVKFYRSTAAGKPAKISGPTGLQGVPMVSIGRDEEKEDVTTWAMAYGIDFEELAAASSSDRADMLEDMLDGATECKRALDETLDRNTLTGDDEGFRGILDDQFVKGKAVTPITEGSDPDADLRTLQSMMSGVVTGSNNTIKPNRLALPLSIREIIASKHRANTDSTVLQRLVESSPYLASADDVIGLHRLDGRPGPGGSTMNMALAFAYDPMVVRAKALPPMQWKVMDLAFGRAVVWVMKASPVQWKRPLGGRKYHWATAA